ncbi:MAG: hypothetical protein COY53_06480 [Elusimicrobia bacterium CG_4_10_14_0_8_um_filter_37_32]|nr:MAG: hypothetical protein COS17_08050 [Elusimicrobia bacterium CG02_land_8_20_14_3_00_37_13]PIZ13097.1 MAG: hypothetical protein COY53_06480 [Elusimicrobia bacterium CG_4_10_14_0_8_um_filter_37_32]
MDITKFILKETVIIGLIEPINLQEVSLDTISKNSGFSNINFEQNNNILFLQNPEKGQMSVIQANRFEFIDRTGNSIVKNGFDNILYNTLNLLPKLVTKAIGINYIANVYLKDVENIGLYIQEKFIKDKEHFEKIISQPVLASSIRMFLGTKQNHKDIRLFPIELDKDILGCQIHTHLDINSDFINLIDYLKEKLPEEEITLRKILQEL